MDRVMSKYQLRANVAQLKKDSFASCAADDFGSKCSSVVDSLSQAASNMKRWTMYSYKSLPRATQKAVEELNSQIHDIVKSKD